MYAQKRHLFQALLLLLCAEPALAGRPLRRLAQQTPALAPNTQASTANPVATSPAAMLAPSSIELLRARLLKKNKSATATKIAQIIALEEKENYQGALNLTAGITADPLFEDYAFGLKSRILLKLARKQIELKQFERAVKNAKNAFQLTLEIEHRFPYSSFLPSLPEQLAASELVQADGFFFQKNDLQAQSQYEKAFQRLSQGSNLGSVWPDQLSRYAQSCKKRSSDLCKSWLFKFLAINSKSSEESKAIAAYFPELLDKAKPPATAKQTQTYRGMDLDLVAFETAMSQYADEKYSKAIKSFYRFLDEYPRSQHRFRARFWMAQALTQEQEHEKAQRTYQDLMRDSPLTWYGLLASFACGKSLDELISGTLPDAEDSDPYLQPHEVLRLKRVERFLAAKEKTMAAQELKQFKSKDQLSSTFLLYLATLNSEASNHSTAFGVLSELISRADPSVYTSYGLRLVFPLGYWDQIQKYATLNAMDPILILSLMKQESAFQADVGSNVGATGLMQLMPATAVDTDPMVKRAELVLPEVNIRIGTKYLRKMLDKYNGNIVFALAAYNAGPGAVDRWIRETRAKHGMLEFIELIPYRETREYVGTIIRNYFWYSKRIKGEAPNSLGYFWNVYGPPELFKEAPQSLPKQGT